MSTLKKNKDRFWVVDISNSFTKFALSNSDRLFKIHRYPTPRINSHWIQKKFRSTHFPVVLSSVVPQKTTLFKMNLQSPLHLLNGKTAQGIQIDYPKPNQIGADRIANAIAAFQIYGGPAVVIDFGTAVTFDVISKKGFYSGGIIAPGLNVMTHYLHEKTALLPLIKITKPKAIIGKSTREAMLSGAVYGYQGLVKEILLRLKNELKESPKVIATGGQASIVTEGLSQVHQRDPDLTLQGLRLFYQFKKNNFPF